MASRSHVQISKFLSLVLRHSPERIGLQLDSGGWASVPELLQACRSHGFPLSEEELRTVVQENDKQRFVFSPHGHCIRASQGHSLPVELGYEPATPPEVLYHGTTERFLPSIRTAGLLRGRRQHVHLSGDVKTARLVGRRRGKPLVLQVQAGCMHREGQAFHHAPNGVWLTEHVPASYLIFPDG